MLLIILTLLLAAAPLTAAAQVTSVATETTLTGRALRTPDWTDATREKLQFDGEEDEAIRILSAVVDGNALGYWPAEVELVGALAE